MVPPAAVDNSGSLFLAARGIPSQGAVCRSIKTRDAQRLENMSNVNEGGDCGCGLRFQEKEVEDTSPLDRSVLVPYGFVSL